jgi:uncharacterized hydrophobic protein (TIGR00271 family)
MTVSLQQLVLPASQRRTLEELDEDLNLRSGDAQAKQSAFWTMLVLSAVIASAGVLGDSTATVIGAMIIAPLSTPIMGFALSIVMGRRTGSLRFVVLGAVLVIAIGAVCSLVVPQNIALLSDGQIASRTSPGLADLVAAIATGFAGAVALSRKDVAAVLPGVAIAISLVPPLAVVGVCLGQGSPGLALGALLLFVSNFLAMIAAGVLTYAALGYSAENTTRRARRPLLLIVTVLIVVAIPLVGNTLATYTLDRYTANTRTAAVKWVASTPGAAVTKVQFNSPSDVSIYVRHPGQLPPYSQLLQDLRGVVPDGVTVHVSDSVGSDQSIGTVGS